MIRKIIKINEEKCNGCGACAAACHEGAIGMVDGKAKLLREDYCDGLGDCLPTCPVDAITFEEREAPAYNEAAVLASKAKKSPEVLPCGCPGTQSKFIKREEADPIFENSQSVSRLSQWPVQIKLVPVNAPYFDGANLLIAADCTAYAYGKFHEDFIDTAEKTTEYILREMTSADGGFYSAQDADSEGVEGKYYTFTLDEIINVLGEEKGKRFAESFDITSNGNFEGVNILNLLKSNDLESDFSEEIHNLYDYRKKRTNLHLDDKILLSWNSLMIAALSMFYRVSRNEKYLNAVVNAQKFIEENMCDGVQLFTSWRDGKHSEKSFLDDYAFYIASLIELYNSTLDKIYLEKAERFCDEAVRLFEDCQRDGFYLCEASYTEIFMNPKETYDGAIPSGNSVMAYNFVRMFQLTENEKYRKLTEKQFEFLSVQAQDYPAGHSVFLLAKLLHENPPEHIVIAVKHKSDFQEIQKELPFLANVSVVLDSVDYPLKNDKVTYYVCKNHTCSPPTNIL